MLFDRIYKHVPPVDQNAFTLTLNPLLKRPQFLSFTQCTSTAQVDFVDRLSDATFTAMDIHVSSNNRLAYKRARFLYHVPSHRTHEVTRLIFLQSAYRRLDGCIRYGKRKMSTFAGSESITLTTAVIAYSILY